MLIDLSPTVKNDLDFVLAAEQHESNRPFISQWTHQQHEAALEDKNISHLIIKCISNQLSVGYIILEGLADVNESIQLRRIVVTDKGKGYGKEALRLIKKLAFAELHIHRLWLDVKEHNFRAQRLYESVGFVREGILRECLKTGERFESLIVMSILQNEYQLETLPKGAIYGSA
jgi:diamine N-acetyltransferase